MGFLPASLTIQQLTGAVAIGAVPVAHFLLKSAERLPSAVRPSADTRGLLRAYYNRLDSYVLDYFFIVFYVFTFLLLSRIGSGGGLIQRQSTPVRLLLFAAWIAVLDVFIAALLRSNLFGEGSRGGHFAGVLREWAAKAGWRAIVWDIVYICVLVGLASMLPIRLLSGQSFWVIVSAVLGLWLLARY